MAESTLLETMKYFGMTSNEFRKEWQFLTEQDKAEIREGIGNGTETY